MDGPFPTGMVDAWKTFLGSDHLRESGRDCYDDVFASSLFFPLQRKLETAEMIQLARSIAPRTVMEIGADKGGGLYHWIKGILSVQAVVGCEIRGTPYAPLFEQAFPNVKFQWIEGSSYHPHAVTSVRRWLHGWGIDVLFIDGDKSNFLTDFEAYLPMMSKRSIIFMHDIDDDGPRDAFVEVSKRFRTERIVNTSETLTALARERDGISPSCSHESWLRTWRGFSCGVGVIYPGKPL